MVERAYSKGHRANELIRLRRTRATGPIGKSEEDDLNGVSRLAGDAISALNELIGDTPQDAFRRNIIVKLEDSRQSLHDVFDNWQELFPLESRKCRRGCLSGRMPSKRPQTKSAERRSRFVRDAGFSQQTRVSPT